MRFHLLAACACALALAAPPARAQLQFKAYATLVTPLAGTVHTGQMLDYVYEPYSTTNHYVEITGARANEMFNVGWAMHVEYNGNIMSATEDYTSAYVAHCDPLGHWAHYANGTAPGHCNGSIQLYTGTYSFVAYTSFIDNNNSGHNTS